MSDAPLFTRLQVTGSINRYRRHRSEWSWPRVHSIADLIGEAVVGVALGCLLVLIGLEWLR